MFISSWFVILILKANEIVVPHLVSGVVGWLAAIEATIYVLVTIFNIFILIKIARD